jgi:ergothioneine biosynthesis protein EgtB
MAQRALANNFLNVRAESEWICAALEIEDHVVQPAAFISPPKWHLAHTTWFFDRFVLQAAAHNNSPLIPDCNLIFNSYYKGEGEHWLQGNRGHLSRPTVRQVMDYRADVTTRVLEILQAEVLPDRLRAILEIGIHHEKQHQELLLMDIKYIFASHPHPLAYDTISAPPLELPQPETTPWLEFTENLAGFGASRENFAWDNEKPRHRRLLPAFQLESRLVTNADYLAFINDRGYQRPEFWLSDGWDWRSQHNITCPLYWYRSTLGTARQDANYTEYHLGGMGKLQPYLPVSHVSYFEADAFARWSRARLPTEFELEHFLSWAAQLNTTDNPTACWQPGRPVCPVQHKAEATFDNGLLWQWTQSSYSPYPGFVPETGALAEYNGKFMCNQMVLKGGCVATPRNHLRDSYRNFYRPADRWCFSGIRLARDM